MKALLPLAFLAFGACSEPSGLGFDPANKLPTVVSLNPCTDAILVELADPEQILAISHYSHDPSGTSMDLATARQFLATGGTVEEVLALDPDVVLASSFMPPATRTALERLDVRVETFGIASDVDGSIEQVRELGEIVGQTSRGVALAKRIEASVADARAAARSDPIRAVLWQPGGIVPGEGALVSELMAIAGFTNFTAERGRGQADYVALEEMLADPPDVLLVAGNERGQGHPALEELADLPRAEFDQSLLYCGGPTIERALARLVEVREGLQ